MFLQIKAKSRVHTITPCHTRAGIYIRSRIRIDGRGNRVYFMRMRERSFTCVKWHGYILPCLHAIAVYKENGRRSDSLVPDIYSRDTYRKTYKSNFYLIVRKEFCRVAPYILTCYLLNMKTLQGQNQIQGFRQILLQRCTNSGPSSI